MCAMKTKDSYRKLWLVADQQGGFFTARQAVESGFADNTHPYHVRTGNWVREWRGVYRLAHYPMNENAQLVLWSLWSRNQQGRIQGVYSHCTALSIYELSDIMPAKLEMTVPPHFRRRSSIPSLLVLHRGIVPECEIMLRSGYAVTTPVRTVLDIIQNGSVSRDIMVQAVHEARKRGLITVSEYKRCVENGDFPSWLHEAIKTVCNEE